MKAQKVIADILIQGIDLAGTLSGGMSMTSIQQMKNEDEEIIQIKTPGLILDNYSIEVKNNTLNLCSYFINQGPSDFKKAPFIIRSFNLPYYIDIKRITAEFEDGILNIILPFNEFKKDYQQDINIH